MKSGSFFGELQRRNVYKVAIAYAIVGWLLIQIATQTFPFLEIPNWAIRLVILLTALGFPIALIIAWAFELTPEGIKRTEDVAPTRPHSHRGAWIYIVLAGAALSVGLFFLGRYTAGTSRPRPSDAATGVPAKSIAVLPFESLSEDKANAYFADGVQEEILTHLARIADLKVISRSSVMQYKTGVERNLRKIAEQLGVAHVVEGSVQRANNRVRVNAQLIDARNDAHLWANTYDRDLADVFAIQTEIAKSIADQLRAKILPAEKRAIETQPTKDLEAYDLYVRGTEALDTAPNSSQDVKAKFLEAINFFEQALARDPSFFNAQCKLAQAQDQLYLLGGDHTPERLALAEQAVNRALQLRPDAAEAHLARAGHLYSKLDYNSARGEIEIARAALPNNPKVFELSGYIDRRQGRWEDSTRNLERAVELDPQNFSLLNQIALSYESLHEYSRSAAALDRALALRPNDLDTRISRAAIEIPWKADPQPLHTIIESTIRQDPESSRRAIESCSRSPWTHALRAAPAVSSVGPLAR